MGCDMTPSSLLWLGLFLAQQAPTNVAVVLDDDGVRYVNCQAVTWSTYPGLVPASAAPGYRCQVIAPGGLWPQLTDNVSVLTDALPINGTLPAGLYLDPRAGVCIVPTS